jgi:hypothetical protein
MKGPPLELHLGDVVRMRKEHPCGSTDWTVVRLGADIGLRCVLCGRRIMLPRTDLERNFKAFVQRSEPTESGDPDPAPG